MTNRLKLVVICALFNLLFEYSARGFREFVSRPLLVLALFGIYLSYFAMLEDLMVRYRLTNRQVFLVAFLYGLFPTAFLTGNLFNTEIYGGLLLAGVNLGTVIVIGVLAWGVVQGMVTLYLANRLAPRDWDHPRMGWAGWTLAAAYQVAVMARAWFNPRRPRGSLEGYLVLTVLVLVAAGLLVRSLRSRASRPPARPFRPSVVMDLLAFGSVIVFLFLGTALDFGPQVVTSQPLNLLAVTLENGWVILCGVVFFAYRLVRGSDVVV